MFLKKHSCLLIYGIPPFPHIYILYMGYWDTTRTCCLLLPQLDRQQISLKQVNVKQHLKSGLTSGTRDKRKMNLQKVLENLLHSLLTPFLLVFLLFKSSPLPCCHHPPVGTQNYQELTGVNCAGKDKVNHAGNHALKFPSYASLYLFTVPSRRSLLPLHH